MPPGGLSESRARPEAPLPRPHRSGPGQNLKHRTRSSKYDRSRTPPVRPLLARQRPSSPPLDASADSSAPDTPSSAPAFPSPHRVASPLPPPSDIAANSRCRQPAPAPPVFRDAHLSTKQRWPSDRSSARRAPYRSAHQLRRPERPAAQREGNSAFMAGSWRHTRCAALRTSR